MKRETYNERDSGKVYIWALVLPLIVSVILAFVLQGSPKDESGHYIMTQQLWFLIVTQFISAILLTCLYLIYTKKNNISFKASGITKKPNYLMVIICIVIGISMCFLMDKFITIIVYGLNHAGVKEIGISFPMTNVGYYFLAILLFGLLPAVTEELIYRGIILNGLRKMGKWPTIILSALAFCLMHGNLPQFPYTFLLGIVLGYIMFETSNLLLCIIIHFFNNATVLTAMYITHQSSSMPATLSTSYVLEAIGLFVLAVGIIVLAFYLIHIIKKKEENKQQQQTLIEPEAREYDKNESIFSKNTKFKKPEMTVELPQEKGVPSVILLVIGYFIAIGLTIITMF